MDRGGESYSSHGVPMIPFYIFYSMFGFQRVGDLCWAAGDSRARGFLIGGTAGRTTLNGEGLQHEDGHSLVLAATVPNCISYDPTFAYEMAVIVHHGLERMFVERESVYFYITAMNENYRHPAMPEGAEAGIIKGHVSAAVDRHARNRKKRVQLLGSGTILLEVLAAADLLEGTGASAPTSGARRASTSSPATAMTRSAGTCSTRPSRRASPTSPRASRGRPGR